MQNFLKFDIILQIFLIRKLYNFKKTTEKNMVVTGYSKNQILYINLSGEMDECSAQTARNKCDKLI